MIIHFKTFGLKYSHDEKMNLVIDARVLPNPFYIPELKNKTGLDDDVFHYVMDSEEGIEFMNRLIPYLDFYFEHINYNDDIWVGICCTGGQHRSVAVARYLANYYKNTYSVEVVHQDKDYWR